MTQIGYDALSLDRGYGLDGSHNLQIARLEWIGWFKKDWSGFVGLLEYI